MVQMLGSELTPSQHNTTQHQCEGNVATTEMMNGSTGPILSMKGEIIVTLEII
jgi:hypothetical protein